MAEITEFASRFGFDESLRRLTKAIEAVGMSVFATVDHAAGAKAVGLEMPPTTVLFYDSPKGGTPIMQAHPQAALDLPLRVLVREDAGRVLVAFHPAAALLADAGAPPDLAGRLAPAQQLLIKTVGA